MATTGALTVQEAVDRIGFGKFEKLLLAVCGVTWAADAAEVLLLGFALPSIASEFGISVVAAAIPMSFFSLGAWAALYAWTPEIYPTEIRTTGMGWASGMARIAGILSPILGGTLISLAATSAGSLPLTPSLWAAAFAIGGPAVFLLGVETRRRDLPDTVSDPQTTPLGESLRPFVHAY